MKLPVLLTFALLSSLAAQEPALPQGPGAPTLPAAAEAAPPAAPLAPIEKLAEQAQQQLFQAAGQPAAPGVPGAPTVINTGRKATFPAPKLKDPSTWDKESQRKLAVMEVSFGGAIETVMFELYPQDAPQTVSNFLDNCETKSYDGLAFHRAIAGFLVQTGDPLTSDEAARERWGTGGEAKTVPAEIKRPHRKGAVAMGRKNDKVNPGRRSNGYQFYFALGNHSAMDGKYTVFGQVVSGLETIEKIANMPVDGNDCPLARIEIQSLKVVDHKGPLLASQQQKTGDGRKYSKPAAAKGFVERFLERVW